MHTHAHTCTYSQLPENLVPCLAAVRDAAKRVTKVAAECKMPDMVSRITDEEERELRSGLLCNEETELRGV